MILVLQKHDAFAGQPVGDGQVPRCQQGRGSQRVHVGVFKEPQAEFKAEDAAHGLVHPRHRHPPLVHQGCQVVAVTGADHLHIHPGPQGGPGGFFLIGAETVRDHFGHGPPIAHHEAIESPFLLQDRPQSPFVARCRDAVELVERAHHGGDPRFHTGPKRRQIDFPQRTFGDPRGIVVPSPFGRPIAHVMFGAGREAFRVRQVPALETPNHGPAELGSEVGVFPSSLGDPSPAGIPGDIHHRGEGPANPLAGGLPGRDRRGFLHQFGMPGCRLAQRNREDGAEPMDDVPPQEQGNAQPAGFSRQTLAMVAGFHPYHIQQGPQLALPDEVLMFGRQAAGLRHLADLFRQGHAGQKLLHGGFNGWVWHGRQAPLRWRIPDPSRFLRRKRIPLEEEQFRRWSGTLASLRKF